MTARASRCAVCREPLPTFDPPRSRSHLDTICNQLVNPRGGKPEAPEGHPEAHRGPDGWTQGWRPREAVLRRIWTVDRSPAAGWGTEPISKVRSSLERSMRLYYGMQPRLQVIRGGR